MEKEKKYRVISKNRKAWHNYEIVDSYEAGLVLTGSEVKSIREGKVNLKDSYARFIKGELWLIGMHISAYTKAAMEPHEPERPRKLLLHRQQLLKLYRQIEVKGTTLIPLKIYIKGHLIKIEIGLGRGKHKYDKRATIAERDQKRDMQRQEKNSY
jgi:SsrA-binding protein